MGRRTTAAAGWAHERGDGDDDNNAAGGARRVRMRPAARVAISATAASRLDPLTVTLRANAYDPEGGTLRNVEFAVADGSGTVLTPPPGSDTATHTFPGPGTYTVITTATFDTGRIANSTTVVVVAGTPTTPPGAGDGGGDGGDGDPVDELVSTAPLIEKGSLLRDALDTERTSADGRVAVRILADTTPPDPKTQPILFRAGTTPTRTPDTEEPEQYTANDAFEHTWTLPDGSTREGNELLYQWAPGDPTQQVTVYLTATDPDTGEQTTTARTVATSPLAIAEGLIETIVRPTDAIAANTFPYLSNRVEFEEVTPQWPPGVEVVKRQWKIPGGEYNDLNPSAEYDLQTPLPEEEPRYATLYMKFRYTDPDTGFTDFNTVYLRVDVGKGRLPVDALIPDTAASRTRDTNTFRFADRHVNTTAQPTKTVTYNVHATGDTDPQTGRLLSNPIATATRYPQRDTDTGADIDLPTGAATYHAQQVVSTGTRTAYSFPPTVIEGTDQETPNNVFTDGEATENPTADFTVQTNLIQIPKTASIRGQDASRPGQDGTPITQYRYEIGTGVNGEQVARLHTRFDSLEAPNIAIETIDATYPGSVDITLTVTDQKGRTGTVTKKIDFFSSGRAYTDPPRARLAFNKTRSNAVELRDRSTAGFAPLRDVTFSFGDGGTVTTAEPGATVRRTFPDNVTGLIRASVTATDTEGNTDEDHAYIAIEPPPGTGDAALAPLVNATATYDGRTENITVRGSVAPPPTADGAPTIRKRWQGNDEADAYRIEIDVVAGGAGAGGGGTRVADITETPATAADTIIPFSAQKGAITTRDVQGKWARIRVTRTLPGTRDVTVIINAPIQIVNADRPAIEPNFTYRHQDDGGIRTTVFQNTTEFPTDVAQEIDNVIYELDFGDEEPGRDRPKDTRTATSADPTALVPPTDTRPIQHTYSLSGTYVATLTVTAQLQDGTQLKAHKAKTVHYDNPFRPCGDFNVAFNEFDPGAGELVFHQEPNKYTLAPITTIEMYYLPTEAQQARNGDQSQYIPAEASVMPRLSDTNGTWTLHEINMYLQGRFINRMEQQWPAPEPGTPTTPDTPNHATRRWVPMFRTMEPLEDAILSNATDGAPTWEDAEVIQGVGFRQTNRRVELRHLFSPRILTMAPNLDYDSVQAGQLPLHIPQYEPTNETNIEQGNRGDIRLFTVYMITTDSLGNKSYNAAQIYVPTKRDDWLFFEERALSQQSRYRPDYVDLNGGRRPTG